MFPELEKFSEVLDNDHDLLHSWHCNVAMWIYDNCDIKAYIDRNDLANKFMNYFFDIDYDWRKLMSAESLEGGE